MLTNNSPATVSIVIPACNEEAGLAKVLPELRNIFPEAEIVVVDDGSEDGTSQVAAINGARIVRHPYRKGNGAAVKTGARHASGELLVFMDGDGQHSPQDINRLLVRLNEGYDMVVGARQKGSQASLGRGFANKCYNWLAGYMTGHRIEDLTSGLRAVRAEKFRGFLFLLPNGFSYPTTSTMAFFRAGYSVAYEPIHASKRLGSSHLRIWRDGIRFLLIIFRIATLFSPLKLFLPVAFAMFLAASAWYAHTLLSVGRFTNMSALFYTGSVITFMMGLISEQITALMYKDHK